MQLNHCISYLFLYCSHNSQNLFHVDDSTYFNTNEPKQCATLCPKHGTFRLDMRKKRIIDIIIYVKLGSKNKHENKPFLVRFSQTLFVSHPPGTTFSKKVVPAEKKWYFHKALVHTTNKILTSDFYKNPVPLFFQKVVPAEIVAI